MISIHLSDPEPDLLNNVLWDLLWPLAVLGIQSCLSGRDVSIGSFDDGASLPDLPECVEEEEDWSSDVSRKEIYDFVSILEYLQSREDNLPVTFQFWWCSPTNTWKPLKMMMMEK